jgi:hypothetical protein
MPIKKKLINFKK